MPCALRFAVHLIGDLHQPLHVGNGRDRGGNDVRVTWFGRADESPSGLGQPADRSPAALVQRVVALAGRTHRCPAPCTPGARGIRWCGSPEVRRSAPVSIRTTMHWLGAYGHRHLPLLRERLSRAGVRIAVWLNDVLGRGQPVKEEGRSVRGRCRARNEAGRLARLEALLVGIYGPEQAASCAGRWPGSRRRHAGRPRAVPVIPAPGPGRWSERDAVLITYADSLRRGDEVPLATLRRFLAEAPRRVSSARSASCRSIPGVRTTAFAVVDYPRGGCRASAAGPTSGGLAADFSLMADLVIDPRLPERASGSSTSSVIAPRAATSSAWSTLATDLSRVVRPRNSPLLQPVRTYRGLRHVWATFSEDQIDLDFSRPQVLEEMVRVLCFYLANGVRVRPPGRRRLSMEGDRHSLHPSPVHPRHRPHPAAG
ncbi:MAG: S1/P1 nuclease [Gammaproteobacteria bacterium]|nr:S1/P1 nuclease [Gammaproteobacteria bacterium]